MEERVASFFPQELLDNMDYKVLVIYPHSRAQNFSIILDLMKRASFFYENDAIKKMDKKYFCGLKWTASDLQILSSLIDLCTDKIMLFYQKRLLNQYHAREAVRCMCEAVKFDNKNIWCRAPIRLSRPQMTTAIRIVVCEEGKPRVDESDDAPKEVFYFVSPCKHLMVSWYDIEHYNFNDNDTVKELLLRKAIERKSDWCPFLDFENFEISVSARYY